MGELSRWLDYYAKSVRFPGVSGFEILDMLDVRSRIAAHERELDAAQVAQLEDADTVFLRHASEFQDRIHEIGEDPAALRRRSGVTPSQWWWYLDKLCQRELAAA